jgi:hypothetical protein
MRGSGQTQLVLFFAFFSFAFFAFALGCGSVAPDSSNDGAIADAPVSDGQPAAGRIGEACAAVAKAVCDKRVACSGKINVTGVGIIRAFGTMAECLTRQTLQCVNAFRAPGSGHSLATEQECVDALAKDSCEDFFADASPAPCRPAGARVNNTACAFDAQCKSGFCTGEQNALCGTCEPMPAAGASCAASDCGRGQHCDAATTTCRAPAVAGDACDSNEACGYALVCAGGSGAAGGRTCQTTLSELGAACGGTMPGCDGAQGLFCGGAMGAKKCVATSFVSNGMPCGLLSQDSFAGCTAGGCYTATGLAGPGEMGACKANAADGTACDTLFGPGCELPARCILSGNGRAGTCRVPTGTCP